ncbi:MAG: acyl-CoA dehydrogenase family protein [Chloroflexota bacterium]
MDITKRNFLKIAQTLREGFASRADEADKAGKLPVEDIQALKESGYLTVSVDKAFGGLGLPMKDCLAAQLELAQGSASTAIVAAMPVHIFGSAGEGNPWFDEAYEMLCSAVVNEGALINSVASEPALGSPSRGGLPESNAVPTPDGAGWIVNGLKTWTTGGRHITHMLVRLRIEDDAAVMLVRQDMPGVEWIENWGDSLSLRASDSHDVRFTDVVVPADHLLHRGASKRPNQPNAWFPMMMSSVYLGAALASRDAVIKFALERVPTSLGRPISTLPKIQRQIGEIDLALQAAKALLFEVAEAWQDDDAIRQKVYPRVVAAKYQIIEAAAFVTDQALRVAGGSSITKELTLERHFRDVRAGSMQPPSGDTALEIIGRNAIAQIEG